MEAEAGSSPLAPEWLLALVQVGVVAGSSRLGKPQGETWVPESLEVHMENNLDLEHEVSSHDLSLDGGRARSKEEWAPEQMVDTGDTQKAPFAADRREPRSVEDTSDRHEEDNLVEGKGHIAGYGSGGVGVGLGRSPAILRESPRFLPAPRVEIGALLGEDALARW